MGDPLTGRGSRWSIPVRLALGFGLLMAAAGCSTGGSDNPNLGGVAPTATLAVGEGTVVVRNVSFNPSRLTVRVGEEVVWSFDDNGLGHTVTADGGSFDSGRQTTGDFRRVFDPPGEVAYHCEVHARMKGTIVVGP